jgi:hypothetical protein
MDYLSKNTANTGMSSVIGVGLASPLFRPVSMYELPLSAS